MPTRNVFTIAALMLAVPITGSGGSLRPRAGGPRETVAPVGGA